MYVQHSELKGDKLVPLKKEGPAVQVFEQTQEGQVVFGEPGDREGAEALPSADFFQTHREATGDEIDKATAASRPAPADDPTPALEALVKRAEAAANTAQNNASAAKESADKAKGSASDAASSAKDAGKSAGEAAKSAEAAKKA